MAHWKGQLGALVPHRYQLVLHRGSKCMDIKAGWDGRRPDGEQFWLVKLLTNLTLQEGRFQVGEAEKVLGPLGDPSRQELKVWVPRSPRDNIVVVFDGPMRKLRPVRGGDVHRVKPGRVFRTIKQVKQSTRPIRPLATVQHPPPRRPRRPVLHWTWWFAPGDIAGTAEPTSRPP